ncbi:hypothetical protein ACJMK2_008683 [Sinanodonta woodiana]|uniref:Uncharacterized protein n=1 Tax=Sinanodonta woodiana TaxID=1069815 RepID=A0ABD3VMB9_SINWO
MVQAILRCCPVDIGHFRTIKIMIGLLGSSLLLQLITFAAPGWVVYVNTVTGQTVYMALVYDVRCEDEGCTTYPISENEWRKEDGQFQTVSWIVEGLVPILFCGVSLFLYIFSLRRPKWLEPSFLFCIWFLGMATVLQWGLMAPFADIHRIFGPEGDFENFYQVPWNVILHSFSAFLTTIVMLTSLVTLMKKLIVNIMANDKMVEPCMTKLDEAEASAQL